MGNEFAIVPPELFAVRNLQKIELTMCESLSQQSIDDVHALANVLRANRHVTSLDLGHCGFGDDASAALVDAFVNHPTMLELSLSGNHLARRSATAIASLLATNRAMTFLLCESADFSLVCVLMERIYWLCFLSVFFEKRTTRN